MDEHVPERPSWDCGKCGEAWPCANAKSALAHEYLGDRSSLIVYVGICHWEAFDDHAAAGTIPDDLADRFFGWIR
ncbi:hypothetical protein ACFQFC_15845 [Amorphoplanes digitatis]|uniref:Flavin reductase n=1 Tax=Actinoplanes digitatis TaxID=1868 RepID=A0A7W7I3F1_9ACTN|nr:hypothetical protein [Actinoplanes digitatis]MBB4765686.1 hypothetical protein [Actinoplanes digitatis]BFE75562.1 hypothetical protein GCM10020092_088630 [Actinoplanes digitatis]GID98022.1 hypothetical protein Adi01nite_74340 [Actinoplanes digitatis]